MSRFGVLRAIAFSALLGASVTAQANAPGATLPGLGGELISWAVSDFSTTDSIPDKVRDVHIRYATTGSGERSYMLCGYFLRNSGDPDATWVAFATIKTDPYEQWIGGQAEALCERAKVLAEPTDDLTDELQARLNAAAPK